MTYLEKLTEGLKQIKKQGGQWFDFIEDEEGFLIFDNYELAMDALEWNPFIHTEKQFDDQMEKLFDSLKEVKTN
ncbi:hypothetical protein NSQ62_08040 [Solibacillus sp. FSL H8-0523]|uniref:hypothetical protein n=1 Tax=Solibacillus sp. FSL H8-0523 TaxID=2954511 RepID=UPI003101AF84